MKKEVAEASMKKEVAIKKEQPMPGLKLEAVPQYEDLGDGCFIQQPPQPVMLDILESEEEEPEESLGCVAAERGGLKRIGTVLGGNLKAACAKQLLRVYSVGWNTQRCRYNQRFG